MSEYTTKDMFIDIGKDTAKILAAHVGAFAILLGIGYAYSKVEERKAKRYPYSHK